MPMSKRFSGFVHAKISDVHVCSLCTPPSLILSEFEKAVDSLTLPSIGQSPREMNGDSNAWELV